MQKLSRDLGATFWVLAEAGYGYYIYGEFPLKKIPKDSPIIALSVIHTKTRHQISTILVVAITAHTQLFLEFHDLGTFKVI